VIHVLDLCQEPRSLSRYEFVDPIVRALKEAGAHVSTAHYTEGPPPRAARGAVLCGTALQDNGYAGDECAFSWIRDWQYPLLGICAGMQVLAREAGATLFAHTEIAFRDLRITAASPLLGSPRTIPCYHLHTQAVGLPPGWACLAGTPAYPEAVWQPATDRYGILFHPEVRNTWILSSFARLCGGAPANLLKPADETLGR